MMAAPLALHDVIQPLSAYLTPKEKVIVGAASVGLRAAVALHAGPHHHAGPMTPAETQVEGGDTPVCMAWSPDYKYVAAGFSPPRVVVWAVADGAIVREFRLKASERAVTIVAFSPNSQWLFANGAEALHSWDVTVEWHYRQKTHIWEGHVCCLHFTVPDALPAPPLLEPILPIVPLGRQGFLYFAHNGVDAFALGYVYNQATHRTCLVMRGNQMPPPIVLPRLAQFSRDGERLLIQTADFKLGVWHLLNRSGHGFVGMTFFMCYQPSLEALEWGPDDRIAAFSADAGMLMIDTVRDIRRAMCPFPITGVNARIKCDYVVPKCDGLLAGAWTRDGKFLWCLRADDAPGNGRLVRRLVQRRAHDGLLCRVVDLPPIDGIALDISLSPDERAVLVRGDKALHVVSLAAPPGADARPRPFARAPLFDDLGSSPNESSAPLTRAWSADGTKFAVGFETCVKVWDCGVSLVRPSAVLPCAAPVRDLRFCSRGLAAACEDALRVWARRANGVNGGDGGDGFDAACACDPARWGGDLTLLALSSRCVVGGFDVFDVLVKVNNQFAEIRDERGFARCLVESDFTVVRAASFSDDGRLLLAVLDACVRVWDVSEAATASRSAMVVFDFEHPGLRTCAWSPLGNRFAVGGEDGFVRVVDLDGLSPLEALTGCDAKAKCALQVRAVDFCWSPRGTYLVCVASPGDGRLSMIDAKTGELCRTVSTGLDGTVLTLGAVSPDGRAVLCKGENRFHCITLE